MKSYDDGLVRLSLDEFLSVRLIHLISGLDGKPDDLQARASCGHQASLSGYTEWISKTQPAITVGWDWHFDTTLFEPRLSRVGLPNTNILFITRNSRDIAWEKNLQIVATIVDAIDWQTEAFSAIACRYN